MATSWGNGRLAGRTERQDSLGIHRLTGLTLLLLAALTLLLLGGCEGDDCVSCVEPSSQPPVVPQGVTSYGFDDVIIVQWYEIAYHAYGGDYDPRGTSYNIYRRIFVDGDELNPDREFDETPIGTVNWDENFDGATGMHYFFDETAVANRRYEYAVTSVNAEGVESALSYVLVKDTLIAMDLVNPVRLFDAYAGVNTSYSGFDFSDLTSEPVDPWSDDADILVRFDGDGIPFVDCVDTEVVEIQDAGSFLFYVEENEWFFVDEAGWYVLLEKLTVAPEGGYSDAGTLELAMGHVYVVKITVGSDVHYAKFGVLGLGPDPDHVDIVWAYQTIPNLPELSIPGDKLPPPTPETISL